MLLIVIFIILQIIRVILIPSLFFLNTPYPLYFQFKIPFLFPEETITTMSAPDKHPQPNQPIQKKRHLPPNHNAKLLHPRQDQRSPHMHLPPTICRPKFPPPQLYFRLPLLNLELCLPDQAAPLAPIRSRVLQFIPQIQSVRVSITFRDREFQSSVATQIP